MKTAKHRRILYASNWWLEDLMQAVAQQAAARGWFLDFQMCLDASFPESWGGDGVITTIRGDSSELADFLDRTRCPAVTLNQNHFTKDIPCVDIDVAALGEMAAKYFLERNFRSFAAYTPSRHPASRHAYATFEQGIAEKGYSLQRLYWQEERGRTRDTWQNRHAWLRRTLRELPKPIAVLAVEALSPVEIIESAMAETLSVPDEVAVLAEFDIALFRECTTIPLSCITHDFNNHARVACDLLDRMMDGEPPPSKPIWLPPTGIVTRQSTDTIAAHRPGVAKALRYMLAHFAEPIEIEDLVHVSGIYRTKLYEEFEDDLGQPPHEVLIQIRMERAREMLLKTDKKVRVVAEECGFGASVNLYRHFKQRLDVTPLEFRQQGTPTSKLPELG